MNEVEESECCGRRSFDSAPTLSRRRSAQDDKGREVLLKIWVNKKNALRNESCERRCIKNLRVARLFLKYFKKLFCSREYFFNIVCMVTNTTGVIYLFAQICYSGSCDM